VLKPRDPDTLYGWVTAYEEVVRYGSCKRRGSRRETFLG
jgi:hypothetical protein